MTEQFDIPALIAEAGEKVTPANLHLVEAELEKIAALGFPEVATEVLRRALRRTSNYGPLGRSAPGWMSCPAFIRLATGPLGRYILNEWEPENDTASR